MENLENFENKYQITKTIRFGLTLKKSQKKNPSHLELKDLVDASEKRIIENSKKINNLTEKNFVSLCGNCIKEIEEYLESWKNVYTRGDQIYITRDYYKIIAKKAKFDTKITDTKENKPKSQLIKISSLKDVYFGKARKDYIFDYWKNNINILENQCSEFKPILKQYEIAINDTDKAHKKPHLVDFRKMFLSIVNRVCDTLEPIVNYSIVFENIDKLSDEERNKEIKTFVNEKNINREELYDNIKKIRDYFQVNGGYVPLGKVTLNKYTAQQKPNLYKDEIEKIINELKLKELIDKLKGKDIKEYFQNSDKCSNFKNKDLSVVEQVQMFKYKAIPIASRFYLKEYFNLETNNILNEIGKQYSPDYDYSKLETEDEKQNFSLSKYPIKVAFNYAWENLARFTYSSNVNFPEEECKNFLNNNFKDDNDKDIAENANFKLYADLLCLADNIAALEYNDIKEQEKIKEKINKIKEIIEKHTPDKSSEEYKQAEQVEKEYKQVKKEMKDKDKKTKEKIREENKELIEEYEQKKHLLVFDKYFPKIKSEDILKYLQKSKNEKKQIREDKQNEVYNAFLKAKQEIGLIRGDRKNKIKKYKELTDKFKDLAVSFGKNFADLRDKFREEHEINKINYCGIVVEDKNKDRYLLLQPINNKKDTANYSNTKIYETKDGELTTYQVKSLTSKTLNKMIKNPGGDNKDFHSCGGIDPEKAKQKWNKYQNNSSFIDALIKALTESDMANKQNWKEFNWNFKKCNDWKKISKEIDKKSYILQCGKISKETINDLVNNNNCLLLPIVNQDITSKTRENKNQFSKDWQMIFDDTIKEYRLHPEFSIVYRQPTPDYPKPGEKRYSRFQMIANMQCEIMPQTDEYKSKKEQIEQFNNKKFQEDVVKEFNNKVEKNIGKDFYVFGIDRGLKQLATLCVLDNKGVIQGDFEIYTREFNQETKQWQHSFLEKRHILDLSNLRVETTISINGNPCKKQVLVDLSEIKVKDKDNSGQYKDNLQKIKLKQLSYIRELQYQMQCYSEKVKNFINLFKMDKYENGIYRFKKFNKENEEDIKNKIKQCELISKYKEGKEYSDLPIETFKNMLEDFKYYDDNKLDIKKQKLCELDAADKLKSGIVANMVGVITYLLESDKYRDKTYISLENLNRAFYEQKDGITGQTISREIDFKEQENLKLAGVGTYQFFEMQLLKKLFKIQRGNKIVNLVPPFRSVSNYNQIVKYDTNKKEGNEYVYPFGIVNFVDPSYTSQCCPWCDEKAKDKFSRNSGKGKNSLLCETCNFSTIKNKEKNSDKKDTKKDLNLEYIQNGDQNGAYHIALKLLKDLPKTTK